MCPSRRKSHEYELRNAAMVRLLQVEWQEPSKAEDIKDYAESRYCYPENQCINIVDECERFLGEVGDAEFARYEERSVPCE
jgi:hypothetical protein